MITKVFKRDNKIKIVIQDNGWAKVFNDDTMVAHLTCEEEAHRVIWLGLIVMSKTYRPITDDMFEEITDGKER